MRAAIAEIESGAPVAGALAALQAQVIAAGFSSVDYAALADSTNLAALAALGDAPARLLVAARIGGTRLMDNMAVGAAL
jgi:pantoate--beta-alanine ligase